MQLKPDPLYGSIVVGLAACVALCLLLASPVAADRDPRIAIEGDRYFLELPVAMEQALGSFDAEFEPRRAIDYSLNVRRTYEITEREAPFAAVGDFNGDEIPDVVVDGDNRETGRRLLILSSGESFAVQEIEELSRLPDSILYFRSARDAPRDPELGPGEGLSLVRRQRLQSSYELEALEMQHDAFATHFFEKASTAHYLDAGVWLTYTLSD